MNTVHVTGEPSMLVVVIVGIVLLLAIFGGKAARRFVGFGIATMVLLVLVAAPFLFSYRMQESPTSHRRVVITQSFNDEMEAAIEGTRNKQKEIKKVRRELEKQARNLQRIREEGAQEVVEKVQQGIEELVAKLHETEDLEYHNPDVEIQLDDIDAHVKTAKQIAERIDSEVNLDGEDVANILKGIFSQYITETEDGYRISLNFGDDESEACGDCPLDSEELPSWVQRYVDEDLHEPKWDSSKKVYRQIVEVGPYGSEAELDANRRSQLSDAFQAFATWRRMALAHEDDAFDNARFDEYYPLHLTHNIEKRYVTRRHVSDTFSERLELAGSDGHGKLEYLELEFDDKLRRKVDGHWHDVKSSMRAVEAGTGAMGILGLVGIVFGYLKFSEPKIKSVS